MKNLILFLIVLISFSYTNAQNKFAPVGAEWWYNSEDHFWEQSSYMALHATVTHDTLIEGITCQVIKQEGYIKGKYINVLFKTDTVAYPTLFVYDNEDTVFIYNQFFQKFTPLYIYNVTIGQTLCLPAIPDLYGRIRSSVLQDQPLTDSSFCIIIDDIKDVLYDNTILRTVYSHALLDTSQYPVNPATITRPIMNWGFASFYKQGMYAKKIGGVHGGILPKAQYFRGMFDAVEPTAAVAFHCYQDSNVNIRLNDCNALPVSIAVKSVTPVASAIAVFPNPSKGAITIQSKIPFTKDTKIHITDMTGKTVKVFAGIDNKESIQINLEALMPGMYLMQFQLTEGNFYHKIVLTR